VEHEIAGHRYQQMFAAGPDRLDGPSGERPVLVDACQRREHRFEPDDGLPGERAAERPRRAKDGVAFGHRTLNV
jgi:hypothetical protein